VAHPTAIPQPSNRAPRAPPGIAPGSENPELAFANRRGIEPRLTGFKGRLPTGPFRSGLSSLLAELQTLAPNTP